MGIGASFCMYDVVVKSSRLLSHLLMSSCSASSLKVCSQKKLHILLLATPRGVGAQLMWRDDFVKDLRRLCFNKEDAGARSKWKRLMKANQTVSLSGLTSLVGQQERHPACD